MPTTNEDGTITGNPFFYVNYPKFIRRAGLEQLNADDVKYVVVRLRIQGDIMDLQLWGIAGENTSCTGTEPITSDNFPECSGENEYLIFDMTDRWMGQINNFAFEIADPYPDTVVYIEEIALFADEASVNAYCGQNQENESDLPDNSETVDAETNDPETNAQDTSTPDISDDSNNDTDIMNSETASNQTEVGCNSVIELSATTVIMTIATFVTVRKLKKKD